MLIWQDLLSCRSPSCAWYRLVTAREPDTYTRQGLVESCLKAKRHICRIITSDLNDSLGNYNNYYNNPTPARPGQVPAPRVLLAYPSMMSTPRLDRCSRCVSGERKQLRVDGGWDSTQVVFIIVILDVVHLGSGLTPASRVLVTVEALVSSTPVWWPWPSLHVQQ